MSKLVHTDRRGRQVSGGNGSAVVYEGAPGGARKLRCPGSHQLAVPARTRDGSSVMRAPNGTTYVSKPLK